MPSIFKVGSSLLMLLVLAASSLLLGEIPLVLGYILIPVIVLARWPEAKRLGWVTVFLFGSALILHLAGFKILGSATVANLESLRQPRRIAALLPPNALRFQDGSIVSIERVFFPQAIEVTNSPVDHYQSSRAFHNIRVLLEPNSRPPIGIQVEVTEPTNSSTGIVFLQKQSYWCGNTWFPQFFPRRLPRHVRADLGPLLISAGLALPTAEHVINSQKYNDPLLVALEATVIPDLPQQHPEVEKLGLALMAHHNWTEGLELLIGTGATNALSIARKRILEQLHMVERTNPGQASTNAWVALLQKIEPELARKALSKLIMVPEFDTETVSLLAGSMAELGDVSGFDLLASHLNTQDLSSEASRRLSRHLQSWFRFDIYLNGGGWPDDIGGEFLDWYREVRPRLSFERLPTGRRGFALDRGTPFNAVYYRSMETFKDRIARRHGRNIVRYRFYDVQ